MPINVPLTVNSTTYKEKKLGSELKGLFFNKRIKIRD